MQIEITLSSYNFWENNTGWNLVLLFTSLFLYMLSAYPLDLWYRLSIFAPALTGLWMYQYALLCPCADNGYASVLDPKLIDQHSSNAIYTQALYSISLVSFCLGGARVTSFVGRRVGAVLGTVTRVIFFFAVCYWIYICLVSARLLLV